MLQASSAGGYEAVVQLLLDKDADINVQGGRYGSVLQAALAHSHEVAVRLHTMQPEMWGMWGMQGEGVGGQDVYPRCGWLGRVSLLWVVGMCHPPGSASMGS